MARRLLIGAGMDSGKGLKFLSCSIDMRFAPEDVERAIQLLRSVTGPTRVKRGCRTCSVEEGTAEAGLVHYREEWDEEAFPRHVRSEEFRRVLIAMELCCEEPQVVIGNLIGQRGLAYLCTLREGVGPPA